MIDQSYSSVIREQRNQKEAPSQIRTRADRFEGKD